MRLDNLPNQEDQPLNLTWVKNPTRILKILFYDSQGNKKHTLTLISGIFFSYDSQGNNEHTFELKIEKLQTDLDKVTSSHPKLGNFRTQRRSETCNTEQPFLLSLLSFTS